MASMPQARARNAQSRCAFREVEGGAGRVMGYTTENGKEYSPSPGPHRPSAWYLRTCQACPALLRILAHTRELLSAGRLVSMETSSPSPFPVHWLGSSWSTQGTSLRVLRPCRQRLQHELPSFQLPSLDPQDLVRPLTQPPAPSLPPPSRPSGISCQRPWSQFPMPWAQALPIHVLLNHLKKMHPHPGRIC